MCYDTANSSQSYEFILKECITIAGPGVAQRIERGNVSWNNIAAKVIVGQCVLFEHITDAGNQILWLGQIMSSPDWGVQGKCQNNLQTHDSYYGGNLKVEYKEVALNVMWYKTVGSSDDVLD